MKHKSEELEKIAREVAENKKKILDDFFKAYLADTALPISDIELVHEVGNDGKIFVEKFYFQVKEKPKSVVLEQA